MDAQTLLSLARGMAEKPVGDIISSWDSLLAYIHLAHGNERVESFRVLFLDKKNRLVQDSVMGVGTVDHVPVYPREVLRAALLCDACAMILVHNHPSGDPAPSRADITMTKSIRAGCEVFGITLHDHVIIGAGCEYSMRAHGDI